MYTGRQHCYGGVEVGWLKKIKPITLVSIKSLNIGTWSSALSFMISTLRTIHNMIAGLKKKESHTNF